MSRQKELISKKNTESLLSLDKFLIKVTKHYTMQATYHHPLLLIINKYCKKKKSSRPSLNLLCNVQKYCHNSHPDHKKGKGTRPLRSNCQDFCSFFLQCLLWVKQIIICTSSISFLSCFPSGGCFGSFTIILPIFITPPT